MKIFSLITAAILLIQPLSAQEQVDEPTPTNAELVAQAEAGNIEATQQLYTLHALAGETEQAKKWAALYEQQLTKKAEQGDAKAMMLLAGSYLNGRDYMPQDTAKAVTWFTKAAEKGQPSAAYILGEIFNQQGNLTESKQFYRRAWDEYNKLTAQLASPLTEEQRNALYWQGYMQLMGIGTEKNPASGIQKLKQADNEWAWRQLYRCYVKGIGVEQNLGKALDYARQLADKADDGLMAWVTASAYLKGKGIEKDEVAGRKYLDKAAAANIAQAIHHKGTLLRDEGKSAAAYNCFNQAASMGLPEAMTEAAKLLLKGAEGVEKDEARALSMLQSAALRYESPHAAMELGLYYDSVGEPELANSWYKTASDRGVIEAMARRGLLHITPNSGLNWSPTQMYRWWKTGSNAGDETCSLYLNLFLFGFIPLMLILSFGVPILVVHLLNKNALKEEAESEQNNPHQNADK